VVGNGAVQPAFIASAGDDMLLTPLPPSIETMPLRSLDEAGVDPARLADIRVSASWVAGSRTHPQPSG
jgi:hypothetical protein